MRNSTPLERCRQRHLPRLPLHLVLLGLALAALPTYAGSVDTFSLNDSIATASTADDHTAIAIYYQGEASRALDQAAAHKRMGKTYQQWGPSKGKMRHKFPCKDLIRSAESTAKGYATLAAEHHEMAKHLAPKPPLRETSQLER